jgi:hypothetical protein
MAEEQRRRVLEPTERFSEMLFGLIMVLTFTGSLSAATSAREDVKAMLIGAIGCNLAWGIVDAVMYLMSSLAERGRNLVTFRALRTPEPGRRGDHGRRLRRWSRRSHGRRARLDGPRVASQPEPPGYASLPASSARRLVFLLVFLSTFPVVVPFFFMHDAVRALRVSNAVAIALLFYGGYEYGKYSGFRPWRTGFTMVAVGLVLVALTIALGG